MFDINGLQKVFTHQGDGLIDRHIHGFFLRMQTSVDLDGGADPLTPWDLFVLRHLDQPAYRVEPLFLAEFINFFTFKLVDVSAFLVDLACIREPSLVIALH